MASSGIPILGRTLGSGSEAIYDYFCSFCNTNEEAEQFCANCDKFYCKRCWTGKHYKLVGHKEVVRVSDLGKQGSDICQMCQPDGKRVSKHCEDHDQSCCRRCAETKHRVCLNVSNIDQLASGVYTSTEFNSLKSEVEQKIDDVKYIRANKERTKARLQTSKRKSFERLGDYRKSVNAVFDKLEKEAKEDILERFSDLEVDLGHGIDDCEYILAKLRLHKLYIECGSAAKPNMLMQVKKIRHKLAKYDTLLAMEESLPQSFEEYEFNVNPAFQTFIDNVKSLKLDSYQHNKQCNTKGKPQPDILPASTDSHLHTIYNRRSGGKTQVDEDLAVAWSHYPDLRTQSRQDVNNTQTNQQQENQHETLASLHFTSDGRQGKTKTAKNHTSSVDQVYLLGPNNDQYENEEVAQAQCAASSSALYNNRRSGGKTQVDENRAVAWSHYPDLRTQSRQDVNNTQTNQQQENQHETLASLHFTSDGRQGKTKKAKNHTSSVDLVYLLGPNNDQYENEEVAQAQGAASTSALYGGNVDARPNKRQGVRQKHGVRNAAMPTLYRSHPSFPKNFPDVNEQDVPATHRERGEHTIERRYNIKLPNDEHKCNIQGMFGLSNGNILLSDTKNRKLKLIDEDYKVIDHCELPAGPRGVCAIDEFQAVAALSNKTLQFVTLVNMKPYRSISLSHCCSGLTHFRGKLYVTEFDGKCVYVYDTSGNHLTTIPGFNKTQNVYITRDGQRLYVIDYFYGLQIISPTGSKLPSGSEKELKEACGVCTDTDGNVYVSGWRSSNVVKFGNRGTQSHGTVVSWKDGIRYPTSIWFDSFKSQLIVSNNPVAFGCDYISVFDVK